MAYCRRDKFRNDNIWQIVDAIQCVDLHKEIENMVVWSPNKVGELQSYPSLCVCNCEWVTEEDQEECDQ